MAYMQESELGFEEGRGGVRDRVGLEVEFVAEAEERESGMRKMETISGGRVSRAAVMLFGASGIFSALETRCKTIVVCISRIGTLRVDLWQDLLEHIKKCLESNEFVHPVVYPQCLAK